MKREPESVRHLAAMINGEQEAVAANTRSGAMQVAFAIFANLKWKLRTQDHTQAEAIQLIQDAIQETKKKVLVDDVAVNAISKYQAMLERLK